MCLNSEAPYVRPRAHIPAGRQQGQVAILRFLAQPSLETCLNRPLFKSCFLLGFYCLRVSEESRGVTGYGFSGWRSCEELSLRNFFPFLKEKPSHVNFINKHITYITYNLEG